MGKSDDPTILCCDKEAFSIKERLREDEDFQDVTWKSFRRAGAEVTGMPEFQDSRRIAVMKRAVFHHEIDITSTLRNRHGRMVRRLRGGMTSRIVVRSKTLRAAKRTATEDRVLRSQTSSCSGRPTGQEQPFESAFCISTIDSNARFLPWQADRLVPAGSITNRALTSVPWDDRPCVNVPTEDIRVFRSSRHMREDI